MDHDVYTDISKSQRKREMDELKQLGSELLEFTDDALRQLCLPDELLDAIRSAQRINSHGARKRQLQYIGKLMRGIDETPIRQAIEARDHQQSTHTREFHLLEELREKLLARGDSALPDVLAQFPRTDRQHLRKLVRQARKEQEAGQPPRAARLIFRYLRELQEESEQPY
ncbi:MAG: ribosome biogenesis factor YjgA [Gammaproteobacteria bacterium]